MASCPMASTQMCPSLETTTPSVASASYRRYDARGGMYAKKNQKTMDGWGHVAFAGFAFMSGNEVTCVTADSQFQSGPRLFAFVVRRSHLLSPPTRVSRCPCRRGEARPALSQLRPAAVRVGSRTRCPRRVQDGPAAVTRT